MGDFTFKGFVYLNRTEHKLYIFRPSYQVLPSGDWKLAFFFFKRAKQGNTIRDDPNIPVFGSVKICKV